MVHGVPVSICQQFVLATDHDRFYSDVLTPLVAMFSLRRSLVRRAVVTLLFRENTVISYLDPEYLALVMGLESIPTLPVITRQPGSGYRAIIH
jgi:hypothetical protein